MSSIQGPQFSLPVGLTRLCYQPIGLQNPRKAQRALRASSQWDKNHNAALGRLHNKRVGRLMGAWSAKRNDRNQWLQVDLQGPTKVTKITTQGRQDANQWVKSYYVYYSQNGGTFELVRDGRRPKVWMVLRFSHRLSCGIVEFLVRGN